MPTELGFTPPESGDFYRSGDGAVRYNYVSGLLQLPVASDEAIACDVVRAHAPVGQRTVSYFATNTGAWPKAPKVLPARAGEYLSHCYKIPHLPRVADNGDLAHYTIEVMAVYIQLQPDNPDGDLEVGAFPNSITPASSNKITSDRFVDAIFSSLPTNTTVDPGFDPGFPALP